jgi:hypothetical protein
MQLIVWVSAASTRTSVTTALMSMAMLSTLKVFFMTKKRARSRILSKGQKSSAAAGELQIEDPEEEKGGVDSGMKGKKWNATVGTYLGDASGLICMDDGSSAPPVQAGGRTEKIITIIDDRNNCDSRLLTAVDFDPITLVLLARPFSAFPPRTHSSTLTV